MHPARDQQGLAFQDGLKQRQSGPLGVAGLGEVTINDVVGKTFDGFLVAARGEILEGSDPDVAGCDAGQHSSGQLAVAINRFAGRDSRQRPSGRNSERMHRFADEIFAQDRPQRGAAVSAPRKRRPARALQLDVAPLAATVQDLAEEDRAAIAKLRNETPELMPGVGHRDRLCARRRDVAGKHRRQLVRFEALCIDPQFRSERFVELDQARLRRRRGSEPREKTLRQPRVAVGEDSDRAARAFDGRRLLHRVSRRHASQFPL